MKSKPIFQPIPLDYDEHANTRAREDFNNIIRLDNIKVHDESDSLIDDDDYDLIINDSKEHDDNLDIVVTNDSHTNTIPLSNEIKKSHESANTGRSPGSLLRQMREQKNISLQEVGKDLSLDVHVVEKLEADNYDDLPPLTFIRGYVRNYAKFLGISEQAIMVSFDEMNPPESLESPIIIPPQDNGNTAGRLLNDWRNIGTIVLSIPLILMLLWLFYPNDDNEELIESEEQWMIEKDEPQSNESDKKQSPPSSSGYISLENNQTPEKKQEYPVVSENDPTSPEETSETFISEPTSSIKYLSVHLKKEDVWMRITDSTGKKLHGGTVKAGTVLSFKGEPPFYIQTARNDFDIEYEGRIKRIGMYPKQPGENNISIIAPSKQFLSVQLDQKDVWMRITDSTGKKLHGGTVKAGETLNLMGKSPFYIQTIRDDFSIKYQGKTNKISEYRKQGNQFIIK